MAESELGVLSSQCLDRRMSDAPPPEPFFLIVIDHDRGVFCVEGPMTDDVPLAGYDPSRPRTSTSGISHVARRHPTGMRSSPPSGRPTSWPGSRQGASCDPSMTVQLPAPLPRTGLTAGDRAPAVPALLHRLAETGTPLRKAKPGRAM